MAAKRSKKSEDMASPQQKATPVEPPENGARQVASPVAFFNDPRMAQVKNSGVKNFAPKATPMDAAGNDSSPSPEGDG